ncbi:MAG TPA: DUF4367 domain-containing protein [Candidatus Saccharimonadales bacterium]|nr:DUF4367 domain-containing protein [Candidatus Saccharimonadales bacterium]
MGQNNIIELNGKQYDAITGKMLGESRIKATPATRNVGPHKGRAIDGFIRKSPNVVAPQIVKPMNITHAEAAKPVAVAKPLVAGKGKKMDMKRVPAKAASMRKQERSQTLMRSVVKKPQTTIKPNIKTAGPSEVMAKPTSTLAKQLEKKVSVTQVNPVRLARANHVSKSHHIRRYAQSRRELAQATPVARTAAQYTTATRPTVSAAHAPQQQVSTKASRSVALERAAKSLQAKQNANDLFEQALIHATSHEEPHHKSSGKSAVRRRRVASVFAGLGAFLVIGGFIAYLNRPAIELRVASVHAGFSAELPSYKPTGYALNGGIKATSGKVEMSYRSGDSQYTITQVASDWNSTTLLDQNTDQRGAPTRTVQSEGRTIYIYENGASWVSSGVKYEINGNANLGTDELVSLATSM